MGVLLSLLLNITIRFLPISVLLLLTAPTRTPFLPSPLNWDLVLLLMISLSPANTTFLKNKLQVADNVSLVLFLLTNLLLSWVILLCDLNELSSLIVKTTGLALFLPTNFSKVLALPQEFFHFY